MTHRATASRTALILSPCSWWLHPSAHWDEMGGKFATFGTLVHRLIEEDLVEIYQGISRIPSDDAYEEEVYLTHALPAVAWLEEFISKRAHLGSPHVAIEVGLCFNSKTREYRRVSGGRDSYPDGNEWFCGTADVIVTWESDVGTPHVAVIDWKTGDASKAVEQLMSLGHMAIHLEQVKQNLSGPADTTVELLSVKVDDNKSYAAMVSNASYSELRWHFTKVIDRLYSAPGEAVVGPWCSERYCAHRLDCKAVKALYSEDAFPEPTLENIAQLIPAARLLKEKGEKFNSHIQEWVRAQGGVTLPDGKFYTETYKTTHRLNGNKLKQAAAQYGVPEEAIDACYEESRSSAGFRSTKPKVSK